MPAPPPESDPAMMRTRAVDVIGSTAALLRGAKFSMRTRWEMRPQLRTKGSRGRQHGLANVVDEALDEGRIVAFRHHPDQRLGAGFSNDETALAFEFRLGSGDPFPHAVGFERLPAVPVGSDLTQFLPDVWAKTYLRR